MTLYKRYLDAFEAIQGATKHEVTNDFRRLMAVHYAINDAPFDPERFASAREALKQKTKLFSDFRGAHNIVWLSFLDAKYEDVNAAIDEALRLNPLLDRKHFRSTPLRPFLVSQLINVDDPERRLDEAMKLYELFKQNHPWMTNKEDLMSALVLVQAFDDPIELNDQIEMYYGLLKEQFHRSNELQLVSHLLSFSKLSPEISVNRLMDWKSQLKDAHISVKREHLPSLALLSIVSEPNPTNVQAISDIVNAEKDKHRWIHTNSVLVALQLEAAENITEEASDLLLHGTFAHLLAMQQAMTAAATSSIIVSTSSSH